MPRQLGPGGTQLPRHMGPPGPKIGRGGGGGAGDPHACDTGSERMKPEIQEMSRKFRSAENFGPAGPKVWAGRTNFI